MTHKGFTLIECALTLMIVAMVAISGNFAIRLFKTSEQRNYNDDLQWYIFLREMESQSHQFQVVEVGDKMLELYSPTSNKYYQLECKDDHIYLTLAKRGGGYLPLMEHVTKCQQKKVSDNRVAITITRDDGKTKTAILQLGNYQNSEETS